MRSAFRGLGLCGRVDENPRNYFRNNVESALKLADTVLDSDVRFFIFSSSCAIYGVPQNLPIEESFPKNPSTPMGQQSGSWSRFFPRIGTLTGCNMCALDISMPPVLTPAVRSASTTIRKLT